MSFKLEPLPYAQNALEPHISGETVDFHYNKHHAAYVTKLNAAVSGNSTLEKKSLTEIVSSDPKSFPAGVYNNAAQTWNHTFYWNSLAPPYAKGGNGGGVPTGNLANLINKSFGSFDEFKKKFSDSAAGHFGSGWAWLCLDSKDGLLKIVDTHDAFNPLAIDGGHLKPLLTCDVWEHAYYIDYRNLRPKYIEGWWNLVNWKFAEKNLEASKL
jgi:Fe-Mn family superoxide dismutase